MDRLERWDERNQRRAEFDSLLEREHPRWWVRVGWALVGFLAIGRLLVRFTTEAWGLWVGVPLGAVIVAGFVAFLVREQGRYRALEAQEEATA